MFFFFGQQFLSSSVDTIKQFSFHEAGCLLKNFPAALSMMAKKKKKENRKIMKKIQVSKRPLNIHWFHDHSSNSN